MANTFSFDNHFVGTHTFTVKWSDRYKHLDLEEPTFTVRLYTNKEANQIKEAFFNKELDVRLKEMPEYVRNLICALIVKDPTGFGDFPKNDRPLKERVDAFFKNREEGQQAFLDGILADVYNQLDEKIQDGVFNSLPSDMQGNSDLQPEAAEGE